MTRGHDDRVTVTFDDNAESLTFVWSSESELTLLEGGDAVGESFRRTPPQQR